MQIIVSKFTVYFILKDNFYGFSADLDSNKVYEESDRK